MRRVATVLAAVALAVTFAGTSLASGPTQRVNSFVANFQLLDGDVVIGTVVANFRQPSDDRLVPGTLDVYWTSDTTFPFPESLNVVPARESHAQLFATWFGPDAGGIVAGASGYLCDYSDPGDADCREFGVIFVNVSDGSRMVVWALPSVFNLGYGVGKGAWALTYAGPTGS